MSEQLDMLDNRRRKRVKRAPSALESIEQEALFRWARLAAKTRPELALLHAIPNGGWRHKATAAAMKRQGVLPGVPDICLPVPRGGHGSLYVELKRRGRGKDTSEAQEDIMAALRASGNRVEVCEGWEKAREVIEEYLK